MKWKILWGFLIFFSASSFCAKAQDTTNTHYYLEHKVFLYKLDFDFQAWTNFSMDHYFKNSKFGIWTYFFAYFKNTSGFTGGISYRPTDKITLGTGIGIDLWGSKLTPAFYFSFIDTRFFLEGYVEKGNGEIFYQTHFAYFCSKNLFLGATAVRYIGIGPEIRFGLKNLPCGLSLSPAFNPETNSKGLIFGFDATF